MASKHPSYSQPEKQNNTDNTLDNLSVQICNFFVQGKLRLLMLMNRQNTVKSPYDKMRTVTEFRSGWTGKYLALGHGGRTKCSMVRMS